MSYRLTDDEVTDFAMDANEYIQNDPVYTSILPIKRIKECYKHKWYVNTEIEGPESSKDGRFSTDVRTARTEEEANVQSLVYTFEIPRVEMTMAQNAGVPLVSEALTAANRKMNRAILNLIFTGSNTWDKVSITGMYTGGTVCGTALGAVKWNTVVSPITHLAAGFGQLNTAGFKPPFTWALSSNLAPGLIAKYGAGDPSHLSMIGDYGVSTSDLIFAENSGISTTPTTRFDLFPMGTPAAADGMWFFYKKDPNFAYLAEVMPITVTINPELDIRLQSYHSRVEWRGTVAIVQATSIVYEEEVDLV